MGSLGRLAERAMSHLPASESSMPSVTGDDSSPNTGSYGPGYTSQSPRFGTGAISNADEQRKSPEPIRIGSPTIKPIRDTLAVADATAQASTKSLYGPPFTPSKPRRLIKFLDNQFPGRSDYRDEMMDLGIATSHWLKIIDRHFQQDEDPENAELRLVMLLETIMREWYSVNRPEIPGDPRGLAKLRFLDFKLRVKLHDLGYERGGVQPQEAHRV